VDVSPQSPEDLAVFAVDALDTDELKAFDARLDDVATTDADELGTWREVLAGLAATAAEDPPDDLRGRLIGTARARRAVGAPLDEVEEIQANEAYRRTIAALGELLTDLRPDEWDAPTIEGGRSRDSSPTSSPSRSTSVASSGCGRWRSTSRSSPIT
jgi:hypothetical protein